MSDPKDFQPGDSSRSDLFFSVYYQDLADLIMIFWQFHKTRIANGDMPFAVMTDPATNRHIPFDPEKIVQQKGSHTDIDREYAEGVIEAMDASWQQFLRLATNEDPNEYHSHLPNYLDREGTPVCDAARRFAQIQQGTEWIPDPRVTRLVRRTTYLANRLDASKRVGAERGERVLATNVQLGLKTGARVSTQLAALFGKEMADPLRPVIASKVRLRLLGILMQGIGMPDDSLENPTYPMINPSAQHGINTRRSDPSGQNTRLEDIGLGIAIGCPAGNRVSEATAEYIFEKSDGKVGAKVNNGTDGKIVVASTMLEEFSTDLDEHFDQTIGQWFRDRGGTQKGMFLQLIGTLLNRPSISERSESLLSGRQAEQLGFPRHSQSISDTPPGTLGTSGQEHGN